MTLGLSPPCPPRSVARPPRFSLPHEAAGALGTVASGLGEGEAASPTLWCGALRQPVVRCSNVVFDLHHEPQDREVALVQFHDGGP